MTDDELLEALKAVVEGEIGIDIETAHVDADKTLVVFLRILGFMKSANYYEKKSQYWWYA